MKPVRRNAGTTLIETAVTTTVLSIFMIGITALIGSQDAFIQSQVVSQLQLRVQNALERVVDISSQAVTVDGEFSPLKPTSGLGSHCLRFRLIESVDVGTGEPVYDDDLKVYIYGPDPGSNPSSGLIIGRGANLDAIHDVAAGVDEQLGTTDDNTSVMLSGVTPAVELLIPSDFAPQSGEMFQVDVSPAPIGRLLTFTIRVNARSRDGVFVLADDLIMSERVALRQ